MCWNPAAVSQVATTLIQLHQQLLQGSTELLDHLRVRQASGAASSKRQVVSPHAEHAPCGMLLTCPGYVDEPPPACERFALATCCTRCTPPQVDFDGAEVEGASSSSGDEDDDEMEEGGGAAPAAVPLAAAQEKPQPIIDEDGFEMVQGRRRGRR